MSHFRYVLTHPIFVRWFARLHPFFWPVLYWQMGRIIRWMEATGHMDLLVRIHWWGGITIAYTGDKEPDPTTYGPLPKTFRPLTDQSRGTDLPANLEKLSPFDERWRPRPAPSCEASGEAGRGLCPPHLIRPSPKTLTSLCFAMGPSSPNTWERNKRPQFPAKP
jgi:hypothetical protein